jgi:hypothetical protein
MKVTYTAGERGMAVGGSLRFKLPGMNLKEGDAAPVTCSDPRVELICSHRLPAINGKNGIEFFTLDYLFITIGKTPLGKGSTVSVEYGHNIAGVYMAAPKMAQKWLVEAATDLDGRREAPGSGFYLVPHPPELEFISDRAFYMEVTVPSTTTVNRSFRSVVRLRDRFHNLASGYRGTVTLRKDSNVLARHTFDTEDGGVHTFTGTVFSKTGVHRITAVDEARALFGRSNPSRTTSEDSPQLYWGDTHCHSRYSADTAAYNSLIPDPEGIYGYARNTAHLDFCMVTDHSEDQGGQEWESARLAARNANEPGRFVSFSAFEASFHPSRRNGDKNVYFFSDDEERIERGTTEALYGYLRRRKSPIMVVPHIHCPTNWHFHDPELERVVEVYSHWGCGLSPYSEPLMIGGDNIPKRSYVSEALEGGARLGFIASADHSFGHPGDDFWWPLSSYNGGLAAVYAASLTREGIWNGLWHRRCYATTRARILLDFELNGRGMGEELTLAPEEPQFRHLKVVVHGTNPIDRVSIVKNSRLLDVMPGGGSLDFYLSHTDPAADRTTDYYFVHVLQADGEQAWSSPIWVDSPAPA